MAKIKTHKVEILGKIVDLPINCSTDGHFSTIYGGHASSVTFRIENKFKSLPDLMAEISKVVDAVNALATVVEDLIFYEIGTGVSHLSSGHGHSSAGVMLRFVPIRRETRGSQVRHWLIRKDAHFEESKDGFIIPERTWKWTPTVETYSQSYSSQINLGNAKIIEFTEANILFFETMAEKIKALQARMEEFLQPASILALVSSNQLPEWGVDAEKNEIPNN